MKLWRNLMPERSVTHNSWFCHLDNLHCRPALIR